MFTVWMQVWRTSEMRWAAMIDSGYRIENGHDGDLEPRTLRDGEIPWD